MPTRHHAQGYTTAWAQVHIIYALHSFAQRGPRFTRTRGDCDGSAVFSGNVVVTQGEMKLAAGEVKVSYGTDQKSIETLVASGGVTVANLGDAVEAQEALYTIDSGVIVLSGDVLLTQGPSAMAGQKLTINLKDGTGVMEGRVTTTFVPGGN